MSYHTIGSGFEPQHHSSRRNHSTRVSPIVSDPLDSEGLKVFRLPSLCCILRPWRLIGFFFIYMLFLFRRNRGKSGEMGVPRSTQYDENEGIGEIGVNGIKY